MSDIKITDELLIEELKKRFEDKKKSLKELEKLTADLTEVNKKLSESESLKSHFISNITNEIVNPFTSIVILSKNILSVQKGDWDKVMKMAKLIYSEAFNLDFQLKNIFAAAEIEAGELFLEVSNVSIDSLVKAVGESFDSEAKKKKINIEYVFEEIPEDKLLFKTDSEKLRLILSNLIDNAIKFSKNAKVIVSRKLDEGNLVLSVQDFGIGISENNQQIIFDRFKRLDTGINSVNRGHGLGLSINKALLDFLNGKIDIKSQKAIGTTFTIVIPEAIHDAESFSADGSDYIFDTEDEIF